MALIRFLLCIVQLTTISMTVGHIQGDIDTKEVELSIRFIIEPSDLIVARGKPAILHCVADSTIIDEKVTIYWAFNDKPLKLDDDKRRYVHSNGSLIFNKVIGNRQDGVSDEGVYRCIAGIEKAVLVSKPAELKLAVFSREFSVYPSEKVVAVGETVRLVCELESIPAADITWTFQNADITPDDKRYITLVPGVLYITNVQFSHMGEYRCTGRNSVLKKSRRSNPCKLVVKQADSTTYPPIKRLEFLSPSLPKVVTVQQNQNLVLECSARGRAESINVFWTYGETETAKKVVLSNATKGANVYTKSNVAVSDSGVYTCIASFVPPTDVPAILQVVKVDIVIPPVIIRKPKSKALPGALKVRFECEATGYPKPEISWLHNGELLHMNARIRQVENELLIVNTVSDDSGIYQCVATNPYGSAWAAGQLYVIGSPYQPSAPTGLMCTPINSTQILVSWETTPHNNMKHPILVKEQNFGFLGGDEDEYQDTDAVRPTIPEAYSVHYSLTNGGEELRDLSVNGSIVLSKLEPNKNYTIYVRTYNGVSGSDHSEHIVCHTLEQSETAFEVTASAFGHKNLFVKWAPKSKNKVNDVSKYRVQWRKKDSSDFSELETGSSSTLITGLKSATQYEIRVVAVTSVGLMTSEWTSVVTSGSPIPKPTMRVLVLNSTTLQIGWFILEKLKYDHFKMSYKAENSDTYEDVTIPPNKRNILLSDLKPSRIYSIYLSAVVDAESGPQAEHEIKMPSENDESMGSLPAPTNLQVKSLTPTSFVVSFIDSPSSNATQYLVLYKKLEVPGSETETETSFIDSVLLSDLTPYTLYEIKVRSFREPGVVSSKYSEPIKVRTLSNTPGVVRDLSWSMVNSSTAHITWKSPENVQSNIPLSYVVRYTTVASSPLQAWTEGPLVDRLTETYIKDLKPNMRYFVMVQAKSDVTGAGEPIVIPLNTSSNQKSAYVGYPSEFNPFPTVSSFNSEQWLGICIGIVIAFCCLLVCAGFVYNCRRRYQRRKSELEGKRRSYILEDHEMKVMKKKSNSHPEVNSNMNGYACNAIAQTPLLSPSTTVSNSVPNSNAHSVENLKSYLGSENDAKRPLRQGEGEEETNALLTRDGATEQTTTRDVGKEGDSGFCDKRSSQSPQSKEFIWKMERKNSYATPDDGFCENESNFATRVGNGSNGSNR